MTRGLLENFIDNHIYDIRKTGNGRWIDQKCAFDTVCFVSDCVINYLHEGGEEPFISPDIWHNEYSIENVMKLFGKPDPTTHSTLDEFNKFFRQPLKMLSAAGILSEEKNGSTIYFRVVDKDVLEYIALRERNSLEFICLYIEKTLKDSNLWDPFASFFDEQTEDRYDIVKNAFEKFCVKYTPINTGREAGRIFNKVLNQLAWKYKKRGTIRGRLSANIITIQDIVYNKTNWYDDLTGKDKNIARSDYATSINSPSVSYDYQVNRAKKNFKYFIDKYFNGDTEIVDAYSIGNKASAIHHIFPQHAFPQIAMFYENLIALSSAQHIQKAHPGGNTKKIDISFQYNCLIIKTDKIRKNILHEDGAPSFYDFNAFMEVLNTGLKTDVFSDIEYCNFDQVIYCINMYYPNSIKLNV